MKGCPPSLFAPRDSVRQMSPKTRRVILASSRGVHMQCPCYQEGLVSCRNSQLHQPEPPEEREKEQPLILFAASEYDWVDPREPLADLGRRSCSFGTLLKSAVQRSPINPDDSRTEKTRTDDTGCSVVWEPVLCHETDFSSVLKNSGANLEGAGKAGLGTRRAYMFVALLHKHAFSQTGRSTDTGSFLKRSPLHSIDKSPSRLLGSPCVMM